MSELAEGLPELPAGSFDKVDSTPDLLFYSQQRLVTHIDAAAVGAVTELYRQNLPPGGAILDLMSSWVSHLPPEVAYGGVTGQGMNADELAANSRLSAWFVRDLNADPALPLGDRAFDAATLCVSVQYLQRPVTVFREVRRVLKRGAPFVISFSNRCFPTKAVAIWQALDGPSQQDLVSLYLTRAGFSGLERQARVPKWGDPLWAVIGYAP